MAQLPGNPALSQLYQGGGSNFNSNLGMVGDSGSSQAASKPIDTMTSSGSGAGGDTSLGGAFLGGNNQLPTDPPTGLSGLTGGGNGSTLNQGLAGPNLNVGNPNQTVGNTGATNFRQSQATDFAQQNQDYAGAFSGGNSQYLANMSPEDKNAVFSGSANIPDLLKKYGLTWDPQNKRLFKADDWLKTNTGGVEVNKQTGGTYSTPGMGYVDPHAAFGTSPSATNADPYKLPSGQYQPDVKSGALTQLAQGSGQPNTATVPGLPNPNSQIQTPVTGNNGVENAGKTPTPPPQTYQQPNYNPQQQALLNQLYGSTPYESRNQLIAMMTGVDPRMVNGQINPGYVPGNPMSQVQGYGGNPQLVFNPQTGGYGPAQ